MVVEELLCFLSISGLDDEVSSDHVKISLLTQLGLNVEWSVDVHTEIGIESFGWFWFSSVNIKDLPLLVKTIVSLPYLNISVFGVNTTVNIENLSFFIDNMVATEFEELEPSGISVPDLEVV